MKPVQGRRIAGVLVWALTLWMAQHYPGWRMFFLACAELWCYNGGFEQSGEERAEYGVDTFQLTEDDLQQDIDSARRHL